MKAFDTLNITTGHAHEIAALGYQAVGVYLRSDRTTLEEIQELQSVGIKIFSIWEKGYPTARKYFTAAQGAKDAAAALLFAKKIKQPLGTQIFACVDYDANWKKDGAAITTYFDAFHHVIRAGGYLASVYGSGVVCAHLVSAGYAHSGFLAQSTGWEGFNDYKSKAAIVQGATATLLHFDIDYDTIVDESVCW
jgi:hypothetical protein